jgi:hypothetical protein
VKQATELEIPNFMDTRPPMAGMPGMLRRQMSPYFHPMVGHTPMNMHPSFLGALGSTVKGFMSPMTAPVEAMFRNDPWSSRPTSLVGSAADAIFGHPVAAMTDPHKYWRNIKNVFSGNGTYAKNVQRIMGEDMYRSQTAFPNYLSNNSPGTMGEWARSDPDAYSSHGFTPTSGSYGHNEGGPAPRLSFFGHNFGQH